MEEYIEYYMGNNSIVQKYIIDVCLEYIKVDGTTIANGDIDSLLVE